MTFSLTTMGKPPSMGRAPDSVRTGVRLCATRASASALLGRLKLSSMVKNGPWPRQAVEYGSHAYRTARHSRVQHCTVFCRQRWLWVQSEALSTRQRRQSVVRAGITGGHSAIVLRPHDRKGIPTCQAVSLYATREPGRSPGSDNGHYVALGLALQMWA